MLLGVVKKIEGVAGCRMVQGQEYLYVLGVIDTLQRFDWGKWAEFRYKSLFTKQVDLLSCV